MCIAHTPTPVSTANVDHRGIAGQAGDVVDDLGAGVDGRAGDGGLAGVDRNRNSHLRRELLDHRQHAPQLFVGSDRLGIGPRAFAADVEQVGAVGDQLQGVRDGRVAIEELAAVGKAVRRDVDDAHHQRPARKLQACECEVAT